jgi:DNA-binding transcriptional ArsR family regulator
MTAAIQVVQSAALAERLLKPERLQILQQLAQPDSAAGVAKRLKLPRQTVNYHLRELERSYVISPVALSDLGLEASEARDRFSASYLVSTAARTIRDVTILRQRAGKEGKKIATPHG